MTAIKLSNGTVIILERIEYMLPLPMQICFGSGNHVYAPTRFDYETVEAALYTLQVPLPPTLAGAAQKKGQ